MRVEERSAELKTTNEKLVAEIAERLRTEKSLRESENRFRSLIEEAPVGICFARNLSIVYANPKYHEMFGFSGVDELVGSPVIERIAPQCLPEFADRARRREEGLYTATEYETVCLRKDGSQFSVQAAVTTVHLIDGPCTAGFFLDITERKSTEDALRQSEAKYRSLVEQIPAIVYVAALDHASTKLYISQQVETLVGFSSADYMADPDIWRKRLHSEDRERVMSELNKSHESGEPFISEYRMITKDGETVWFLDQARLVPDETGQPLCLQGVMTDITERKRAEESLRHTEQMLRTILSTSPVGIVLTQDRRIKWANDAWVDLFGFANEHDYVDQPTSIMHTSQESYRHYRKTLYDNMKRGKVSEADAKLARKDCTLFDAHICVNLLEPSDPSKGTISAIADISERKKAEEALQESEEKYRSVVENMQDVFYRADMEGNVTLVSPSGPQMLGCESVDEMIGLNVPKIFYKNPEDRDRSALYFT